MGIFNSVIQAQNNKRNYEMQQETLQWQKDKQAEAWRREDNAVQRRSADMEAAGMSKTLAAGNAAQASSPIAVTAPQKANTDWNMGLIDKANAVMSGIQQYQNIGQTAAQTELLKLQQEKTKADTLKSVSEAANTAQDTAQKTHNTDYALKNNIPIGMMPNTQQQVMGWGRNVIGGLASGAKALYNKFTGGKPAPLTQEQRIEAK